MTADFGVCRHPDLAGRRALALVAETPADEVLLKRLVAEMVGADVGVVVGRALEAMERDRGEPNTREDIT